MKIKFIDSDAFALDYNVGDIYRGYTRASKVSDSDISELIFDINPTPNIYAYNKTTGRGEIAWSLYCQDVFLIVDPETNRILYTSKKYDRYCRGSKFLDELREAIVSGFNITEPNIAEPPKLELSYEVEFMDI